MHVILYLLSFVAIWMGSGLAIKSVERVSRILRVSFFAVSFIILGIFTSMSEFSVGINSIIRDDPEIYVGNLIGASIVICMLIVPLLAITGSKIKISAEFQGFNLAAALVVIAAPVVLAMDGRIGRTDSVIALVLYGTLILAVQSKRGLLERIKSMSQRSSIKMGKELVRILFGVVIIFAAGKYVVEQTVYFADVLNVSPFLISLLLVSVGTNVPELSLVVRSAFRGSNQVAFGDYVGSAASNTFILGVLTLIYGKPVLLTNSYLTSLMFLIVGLGLFYYFARTKNSISRGEGLVLLGLYLMFLATEVYVHRGAFGWG